MKKLITIITFFVGVLTFGEEKFEIQQGSESVKLKYIPTNVVTDSAILSRFFSALNINLIGVPTSTSKIPEKYNNVTRIGRSGTPDFEKIKVLKTELVVSSRYPKTALKPKYDALNIPSVYLDVDTYDKSKEVVAILGKAFNRENEATQILNDWSAREKKVEEKVKNVTPKKIAIIYGNGESFYIVGKKHFLQELIEKINCINIADKVNSLGNSKKSIPFSLEKLIILNPDIILIIPSSATKNGKVIKDSFDKNSVWKLTNAYKNNKIHILNPTLFRMSAGVNSVDALEELYRYVYEK